MAGCNNIGLMDTIKLPIFPSCSDCLSWSADGELAVAAGEHVHILTPKDSEGHASGGSSRPASGNWHVARIRVNSFTKKEWPLAYAQDRTHFSIGREQSLSHVVALSWSPPGLARYRRCLLAVLTANLLLSFYEGVAPGKWVRVAIVNHTLKSHFSTFIHGEGPILRKTGVRSFSWCAPLKPSAAIDRATPHYVSAPECRWGFHFLTITNDDNDVICLQARRSRTELQCVSQYSLAIMSLTSLHDLAGNYAGCQPISLLSTAVKSGIRTTSMSCGPWFSSDGGEKGAYTAVVGVVYGTKLKTVRLLVSLTRPETGVEGDPTYNAVANSAEFTIPGNMPNYHFTGPLQWISTDTSQNIHLAAGGFAGLGLISVPPDVYVGKAKAQGVFETQELPFYASHGTQGQQRLWEPVGAMTITLEGAHSATLHLGTIGGYTLIKSFPKCPNEPSVPSVRWISRFEDLRDEFDIDHDLGGLAIGRVWGLASHRGLIATAATLHPGDMVDYRSAVAESTNIIISPAHHDGADHPPTGPKNASDRSPGVLRAKRELVIGFILHAAQGNGRNDLCNRLAYAAACCTIVESENEDLRSRARETLEKLATATGADLSDEISKCSTAPSPIEPKITEQLDGPGGQLFEKCEICDSGIAWYSAHESQCASGHLFVRCNLSFLSIQEPGISKVCSNCGTEYLSEDRIGPGQRLYGIVSDAFDTCIYCDGKFRD